MIIEGYLRWKANQMIYSRIRNLEPGTYFEYKNNSIF